MQLPYRRNVCVIIVKDGRVFLGERSCEPGHWQLPQGGVDVGESDSSAALREASEETGVDSSLLKIRTELKYRNRYDFNSPPAYARNRWRGQEQGFWVLDFLGTDSDIALDRFEPEFRDWKWCKLQDVPDLVAPVRRKGCAPAIKELIQILATED